MPGLKSVSFNRPQQVSSGQVTSFSLACRWRDQTGHLPTKLIKKAKTCSAQVKFENCLSQMQAGILFWALICMHSKSARSLFAISLEVSGARLTFGSILPASLPMPVISFAVLQLCQVSDASCRVHGYPYREPRFACLFSSVVRRKQSPDKKQKQINIIILDVNVPEK